MSVRPFAIAALCASVLAGCTSPEPPFDPTIRAVNATEAPSLPRYADALPDSDPDGFARLLGQLQGTPVLVNFWGSWCPPCKDEMPRIVAAHARFGDRVQFLGVDLEDGRDEARGFIEDYGMTFPSVFDPPDAIKASLGQYGQPVTLFFDRDGTMASSWTGPISEERLERNLRAIAG